MAEAATLIPKAIEEQAATRALNSGAHGVEHSQQFNKILDLNYEMDRKMVSLVQALGVREVTSASGQEGVPKAGTSN